VTRTSAGVLVMIGLVVLILSFVQNLLTINFAAHVAANTL